MAVYSRDEFMSTINTLVGENNSDENLKIIEDMSDTFDTLTTASESSITKEQMDAEVKRVEDEWKQKYRERFMSGSSSSDDGSSDDDLGGEEDMPLTFDNLFGGKE